MKLNQTQSLSFNHRLHFSWEYGRFFNQSKVFRLKECTVFRVPNELNHFRLGITLKARGSSIDRNQVKRQIREFFRTHANHLGNHDYNVVVPHTKKMSYPYSGLLGECLREQLLHAVSKI